MLTVKKDIIAHPAEFAHLPAKKQYDLIVDNKNPMVLLRSMPTGDLLLIIRELGTESSLEILELMSSQQIKELFDLELWHKDQLNIELAGHYFSALFEANRDNAIAQIYGLDIELIGLMLKTVCQIYDTSIGEDFGERNGLFSISPDSRFIVSFNDKKKSSGLARSLYMFIEELYGRDLEFVLRLLESVRFELSSGLLEESLNARQNRLLDLGILPHEERLSYFAPLTLSDVKPIIENHEKDRALPHHSDSSLRIVVKPIDGKYGYLKAAMDNATDAMRSRFFLELTHAARNMHASLCGDFGDRQQMIQVSEYVKYLAELGLVQASRGDLNQAQKIAFSFSPKYLIRLGRTAIVNLRKRLNKNAHKNPLLSGNFALADSPLREVACAISLAEPRYYEGLLDPKKLTIRFFATLAELEASIAAVNELIFRADLTLTCLKIHDDGFLIDRYSGLTHTAIVTRIMIRTYLNLSGEPTDRINAKDVSMIFEQPSCLKDDFSRFAKVFFTGLLDSPGLKESYDGDALEDRAHSFMTTILISLEQDLKVLA